MNHNVALGAAEGRLAHSATFFAITPPGSGSLSAVKGRTRGNMSKDVRAGIQSVQSAVRVVEEMAALGEAIGVTDLANRIHMPKVRVFRYLRTLQALGYVEQDPRTEKYSLTLRLFQIGQAVADATVLLREAKAVLVRLCQQTQLTSVLSQPEPRGSRVLEISRSPSAPDVLRPGALFDFHASAQGRACLAFGPSALWLAARETELRQWTPETVVDVDTIELELRAARDRGWAASSGQTVEGVNAVAAPIYAAEGVLVATINVVGPKEDLAVPPPAGILQPLLDAAAELSERLGHSRTLAEQTKAAPPAEPGSGIILPEVKT